MLLPVSNRSLLSLHYECYLFITSSWLRGYPVLERTEENMTDKPKPDTLLKTKTKHQPRSLSFCTVESITRWTVTPSGKQWCFIVEHHSGSLSIECSELSLKLLLKSLLQFQRTPDNRKRNNILVGAAEPKQKASLITKRQHKQQQHRDVDKYRVQETVWNQGGKEAEVTD